MCLLLAFHLVYLASRRRTDLDLGLGELVEVRELVGAEEDFLAAGHAVMSFGCRGVDGLLHVAFVDASEESAFLFHFEEELPCLLGDGDCEGLHII